MVGLLIIFKNNPRKIRVITMILVYMFVHPMQLTLILNVINTCESSNGRCGVEML
jgi:hypothetical protein